nr:uncharacterized protein LOC105734582 isoform X1 [Aotus nancymaae]
MKHMDEEGLCIQLSTLNCFLWLYIDEIRMHKETPGQELLQDTLSSAWTLEEDIVMRHPEASMGEPRSMPCDLHPQVAFSTRSPPMSPAEAVNSGRYPDLTSPAPWAFSQPFISLFL